MKVKKRAPRKPATENPATAKPAAEKKPAAKKKPVRVSGIKVESSPQKTRLLRLLEDIVCDSPDGRGKVFNPVPMHPHAERATLSYLGNDSNFTVTGVVAEWEHVDKEGILGGIHNSLHTRMAVFKTAKRSGYLISRSFKSVDQGLTRRGQIASWSTQHWWQASKASARAKLMSREFAGVEYRFGELVRRCEDAGWEITKPATSVSGEPVVYERDDLLTWAASLLANASSFNHESWIESSVNWLKALRETEREVLANPANNIDLPEGEGPIGFAYTEPRAEARIRAAIERKVIATMKKQGRSVPVEAESAAS